jgi:hypothetical protein
LAWWLLIKECKHAIKNRAANGKLKAKMICIEGIIIPTNWDKKGNVVNLAIATRDEEEYLITDKDQIARKVKRFSKLKSQI